MPLQATSGAASYDAFGGGVAAVPTFVEDVFSTYLYTGNGTTQTITNSIDLSTKGGLVWSKNRTSTTAGTNRNRLHDSARGVTITLVSNSAAAQDNLGSASISSFNTNGYTLGGDSFNNASDPWVSWTFRKQPKFFDVVTYTGNGTDGRNIAHSLGAMPACIIVKRTDSTSNWSVYHQGNINGSGSGQNTYSLNTTGAANNLFTVDRTSSTNFNVSDAGAGADSCNVNGATYVAYLFASNAGGFGLTGTDNVISCGSFTSSAGGLATVNLGYEPQWVMVKGSNAVTNWQIMDTMRGFVVGAANANSKYLNANSSSAELDTPPYGLTNTGFDFNGAPSVTFIYIAIRRGPMKVPTDATKVYNAYQPHSTGATISVGFPTDFVFTKQYNGISGWGVGDRLRGNDAYLTFNTNAEGSFANTWGFTQAQNTTYVNYNGANSISYFYRRAPGFFDEVCFTSSGSYTYSGNHNLTVVPELVIFKPRDSAGIWRVVGDPLLGNSTNYLALQADWPIYPASGSLYSATSTTIEFTSWGLAANTTYVAYLFATCVGVSKVFSYTGNGSSQTINCGFTGGARFVLIKRTDSTGDWYVWDSARGIVSGNDPHLSLNSTAAEVTTDDTIDTDSTGFVVNQVSATNVNVSSATYIGIAIA